MANAFYTSNDLIASVKRKIMLPISQVTFSETDVLAFANEEMFIAQVPSVLQFHEEYFVTYKQVPLQTNVSRYPIPNRATGMKLRDLFWCDQNGNMFEMTRIDEHDRAFFQQNVGANQALHKFYVEGNDVVITPGVVSAPSGYLLFVFYLRPNQLVKNERAATISCFNQTIKINNSLIQALDTINIDTQINLSSPTGFATDSGGIPFTAVSSLGGSISALSAYSSDQVLITTSSNHQLSSGQTITISGSNSNPVVDGTYVVTVLSATTFTIDFEIAISGSAGSFTCVNQFMIGATGTLTAASFAAALNSSGLITDASSALNIVTLCFPNIYTTITPSRTVAFVVPEDTIGVQFTSLPTTYTDPETNITTPLFQDNILVDFLQTQPGHRTYVYDVYIPTGGISGLSIYLPKESLLVPTATVNNVATDPNNNGVQFQLATLKVGDYICLANEAIIPQIPPDLHNGLAERTAARILAALGDQQGLQASLAKIQEIEVRQGNLMNNRSEGNCQKIVGRHSLLRFGKFGLTRRV